MRSRSRRTSKRVAHSEPSAARKHDEGWVEARRGVAGFGGWLGVHEHDHRRDQCGEADAELPKQPWFNTSKFPQATFQSSSIKALGGGKFEVAGKLAIKGASKDVVVPVTLTQSGANSTASGAFAIKRLDFKIGEGEWTDTSMVANDVQVKFKLVLTGIAAL